MRINLPSGTPAELAVSGDPPTRGLVLAPDLMGLRPLFDDHAARLSSENGWAVCAVEPFPGQSDLALADRLAARLDVAALIGDLVAGADELAERTGVTEVGILGFCMGGMQVFRAAGTGRFDRGVAFYGMIRPPEAWSVPGQDPLDALARPGASPTLALLGGADPYTPPADVDDLRALGDHVTVVVYDGADHGFVHDPSRPSHRAEDAADAWRRAIAFLL